jgi:hypothetical protein
MSSTTNILKFTSTSGQTERIPIDRVSRVFSNGTNVVINTDNEQYKSTDSYATIKSEASFLFEGTELPNSTTTLYNSTKLLKILSNGSGCFIYYKDSSVYSVSESVSVIEARIDAIGGQVAVVDPTPPTTLSNASYYNLTNVGTYTIIDAADVYDVNNAFQMTIYNNSGSVCTFNRDGSTVFNFLGEQLTTFDLLDGEEITLTAVSTTQYNIG